MTHSTHASPVRIFDIGIVGGGPAGLSAALWAARYGRSVVVLDSGDPRNWESRGVNGYLGLPAVRPAELRGKGRDEARSYGVTLIDAVVSRLGRQTVVASVGEPSASETDGEPAASETEGEPLFAVETEQGDVVHARRVLLAIGVRDVWPDIPGLSHVYGANAHVCPDCDGYEARDKRVVIVGPGRRAVAMALALTTWTSQLTIVTNGLDADMDDDELRQKVTENGIEVRTDVVERLDHVGDEIRCLHLAGGEALEVDKLFFTIKQLPADDLGVQLGCDRDRGEHIVVDDQFATSIPGVYAAGDITPGPQLAVRAAAAGAVAAMVMHKSLVPDHRKLTD